MAGVMLFGGNLSLAAAGTRAEPGRTRRDTTSGWGAADRERLVPRALAPRLLDLLRIPDPPPFMAPIGVDEYGTTVWHDLHHPAHGNLLVEARSPEAQADALRAAAIGLCLTTRPALLQVVAIDDGGRDLMVLESLPHAVVDVATNPAAAAVSLRWLGAELGSRRGEGRNGPDMLLVLKDIDILASPAIRRGGEWFRRFLAGSESGLHVLAGVGPRGRRSGGRAGWSASHLMADGAAGRFVYRRGRHVRRVVGATLSVVDLDAVSRGEALRPPRERRRGDFAGRRSRSVDPVGAEPLA